jgi:hypothetical protein
MPYRVLDLEWRLEPLPACDAEGRWARAVKLLAQAAQRLRGTSDEDSSVDASSCDTSEHTSKGDDATLFDEQAQQRWR